MHVKCYFCERMVHESKTKKYDGYFEKDVVICDDANSDECFDFTVDRLARGLF